MNDENKWKKCVQPFLKQWFNGLLTSLARQPRNIQEEIFLECGSACAHPQAVAFFQKAKMDSKNLKEFLATLNNKYELEVFKYINEDTIQVKYPRCYCPLVELDLVNTPFICECGCSWLQETFSKSLGKSVTVQKNYTILNGSEVCEFILTC